MYFDSICEYCTHLLNQIRDNNKNQTQTKLFTSSLNSLFVLISIMVENKNVTISKEDQHRYNRSRFNAMKGSRFLPNSNDNALQFKKIKESLNEIEFEFLKAPEDYKRKSVRRNDISTNDDPSSIVFWPTKKIRRDENQTGNTLTREERKKFKREKFKVFGSNEHASSCMLNAVIFPASISYRFE